MEQSPKKKKGTTLEHIILLRGVTPNGKNAIPKMSYLVDILTEADFQQVRTYIQSGKSASVKISTR
ncbi:Uncharacterized protein conserved in bacteria [Streptococcus pneumoniae]|nr:Uncharacterized protein conserved in bacteria [Streptococcus pneumoniae]